MEPETIPGIENDAACTLVHPAYMVQNENLECPPVLICVPHAARHYPQALTRNLRLPAEVLLRLEDRYADLLARKAAGAGICVLTAKAPRAWIDMNRAPGDIDADMLSDADTGDFGQMSAKARGGLGLIPRRLSGHGDIWRAKWTRADVSQRVARYHTPYHHKISQLLGDMRARCGGAVLLDLHSMPSIPSRYDEKPVRIVVGDRFGRAASGRMSETVLALAERGSNESPEMFETRLNHPYAGGYALERHGRPENNVHAIQLEIDRALYLDEAGREPVNGVHAVGTMVREMALALADEIYTQGYVQAAE